MPGGGGAPRTAGTDHILVINPSGQDIKVAGRLFSQRIDHVAEPATNRLPVSLWVLFRARSPLEVGSAALICSAARYEPKRPR